MQCIYPIFTAANDNVVRGYALDILRFLPSRSASEIEFVLQLADGATDQEVQEACLYALNIAEPVTKEVLVALEVGKRSQVEVVRRTVEQRLKRRS